MTELDCDICVIGAGSGGLSVAAGASQMGASVVLVEGARMGGDCLNYGCVPSKALLAAAKMASAPGKASRFGVDLSAQVGFGRVNDHVKAVIGAIAPHDSAARFSALGITVILDRARFTGRDVVEAGGKRIRARRFVIATGSRPSVPPIPGLDTAPYFTNETIFDNRTLPDHLVIIGGGPIGMEMAQAHHRLGARVTVLQAGAALARDDREAANVLLQHLRAEGIAIREHVEIERVAAIASGVSVTLKDGSVVVGSHLLVATGRRANVDDMGLEAAGIAYSPKGVTVNARLRSTNRRVYAVGDAAGGPQFTHAANYHAGIVLRNILFRLPAKANHDAIPWVTYTDPELAGVGLSEVEARKRHGRINILRWPYAENDRAAAEHHTEGFVKAIVRPNGKILGATIVGAQAGELIQTWVLALSQGLKIGALAGMVVPYPTLGEISKRAAGAFYTPKLFSPATARLVRFLARFG